MSRTFADYPPDEKVNVLQSSLSSYRKTIEEKESEISILKLQNQIISEVINKLPVKERSLTWKRYNRIYKEWIKNFNKM